MATAWEAASGPGKDEVSLEDGWDPTRTPMSLISRKMEEHLLERTRYRQQRKTGTACLRENL